MAGIGFELRKLYREEGLIKNLKAYAYSSMTTIGPMILCLILVFAQKWMMNANGSKYLDNELFVATMAYCFIFSIILTSGISLIVTRFIADSIYQKKYEQIISSFYGGLIVILPIAAVVAFVFLRRVDADFGYKFTAYIYFMELVIIWFQNVFLSALKDYTRIVRGFAIGIIISIVVSFLLFTFTSINPTTIALIGINIGFAVIIILAIFHFEQVFPRDPQKNYFLFLQYIKKYPALLLSGILVYSGVYIHNFIYWVYSERSIEVADRFIMMPLYDVPVFYAYISVLPSLVFFVIIVETDFYEKFVNYYKNIINGGTYDSVKQAKKKMQDVLLHRLGFLVEVQLLFTTLSIAIGIIYLPRIGFSMQQLDIFIILCLGYFFFIIMFVMIHALMYFDDRSGVLLISMLFVVFNAVFSYMSIKLAYDGVGMFAASFICLLLTFTRLLYVLKNIDYYTFCSQPLNSIENKKKANPMLSKSVVTSSILLLSVFLLSACSVNNEESKTEVTNSDVVVEKPELADKLKDNKRLYEQDVDGSIKSLYITVLPDKTGKLDWYKLNSITDRNSKEKLDVIMAEGTEDQLGPKRGMFGFDDVASNAKISIRGNSARNDPQKSYKIKIQSNAGLWQNQRTLNLNKHTLDLSRIRNKLSFDLMEALPNSISLRTQFVHLYVKDLTKGNIEKYEDYGLYTQVEQPNEMFLKNHLLDPNGFLYKVTFFEFHRYPELIKSHNDPTYNKSDFETILEIKGLEEHDRLIEMLDAVNNMAIPIEDVIDKYFDEENLLTWLAMNILMDNMDTDANNFYLYSGMNTNKWFILPWDYDGGWEIQRRTDNLKPYQAGISNYWGVKLYNRYLRNKDNVEKLSDKIEQLYAEYINEEIVKKQIDKYSIVKSITLNPPDLNYLPGTVSDFEKDIQVIINTPSRAKKRYYDDLQKPKPFFMDDVIVGDKTLKFTWEISFDYQENEDLFYTVTVARDPAMKNVIAQAKDIKVNEFSMPKPANGTYYWKVTVRDSEGNQQYSFDMYTDDEGINFFGVRDFEVY